MAATSLAMEVVQAVVGVRTGRPMDWRSHPSEEEEEEVVAMQAQEALKEQQWRLLNKPICRTCC